MKLTDTFGGALVDVDQPKPGSVLLVGGLHGVAWQRHFSDGRWHSTTGAARSWSSLMRQRNVVLVYNAERRSEPDE
jgi:hypothetical protein